MSLISQAAKRLKSLLATTAGAAQVGFDAGLTYAAGTVGAVIKSLQSSITTLSGQIAGILDGADFTGPVKLPGNASDNLHAVPLVQAMQIAADAAGLAATGVEVGRLLRVERFTASGTFTKQVGDRLIEAVAVGGGGGGGGHGGGGGGAGGTCKKIYEASSLNATEPVVVGIGGAYGVDGGASTFKGMQASGGGAQSGGDASGAAGGGASGGDINITGGGGGAGINPGILPGGLLAMAGAGGASSIGGGTRGFTRTTGVNIGAPAYSGAGGSSLGDGASGYVELRIYS